MVLHHGGFPIRKSTDRSLFAAPRGLSQLVASFIGSWCQGIHLVLFVAWTFQDLLIYAVLSFELLEFHKQILSGSILQLKGLSFFLHWIISTFRWNCIYPFLERPNCFLTIANLKVILSSKSVRFYSSISLFGFQWTLVGLDGLEPSTSRLSGVRSNHLSYRPLFSGGISSRHLGGDDGIRTHDPLLAGQVLSQLSYTPMLGLWGMILKNWTTKGCKVTPSYISSIG